ncbi:YggS family pyridoxal phosphate-dependent enzyme [Gordonia aichiensis]|uniref:YggS family pyridoxal phosphate-dependent enzyme n=1 Tax=Gordonia aichiensis TaxID=36820 RepID=UPI0032674AA4
MIDEVERGVADARSAQLGEGVAQARSRIAAAARDAGRDPSEVTLLVVTKYFPAADVVRLIDLGEREFGESREPEASRKMVEVTTARCEHFSADMIGRVQRKKAGSVARWARRVHSVDSAPLIDALSGAATRARDAGHRDDRLGVLLQVSLDGDPDRGGLVEADLAAAADRVLAAPDALTLDGLMLIAPLGLDPGEAMRQMADIRAGFVERYPDALELSAGMSGDLESAIANGSTCVRVGTAILGTRPILSL